MSAPQPFTPPPNQSPKTFVLTMYACAPMVVAFFIVKAAWPGPWVALALLPLALCGYLVVRAMRSSREDWERTGTETPGAHDDPGD